ncbi:hypothetical protein [Pseudosulfitobacter koreensis]|uniref:Glucosyl transferase GtrII n=1 Tax=Pseudosulfitobacter koreensis TaxID=2968472 RepID=A0ABT1Z3E5_9RHOB|nr:hypothetical protein [Pseudosulfitobacter koreense]MCR8827657.1 hypothetical protein [Pseudosulfitobacter koreense]
MTLAADVPGDAGLTTRARAEDRPAALRLGPVVALALLAVLAISLPNLIDPFMRHDDYPALFAEGKWFWEKTLNEGRWLNYLWHIRGFVTPSWLNFAVYQALWAVLAAAIAVAAMGRDGHPWFARVLALFILIAPPATLISLWFNTLIPGLAVVTLFAVIACWVTPRTLRTLLPLFVIVSFWAYTTYPLLLLAVCLVRTEKRSLRDLIGLCTLFVASFAAAVLLTYTLNWYVHGIFGVPLADWREATPAADLAGMVANLGVLRETFATLLDVTSYGFMPASYFHIAMLVLATLMMLRLAPMETLYLHAGMLMGMGLIVLQVLKLGVQVPPRTFLFAWVFYALIFLRTAALLSRLDHGGGLRGRIARNLALLVVLSYLLQTFNQYTIYRPWQAETRTLAEVAEASEGPILIYGPLDKLSSYEGAYVQSEMAMVFRMRQVAEREVLICDSDPDACAKVVSSRAEANQPPALRVEVTTMGEETRLSLPQGS